MAISIWQQSSEGRYSADIPDLSSIDSIVDEEDIESDNEDSASAPLTITRPRVRRQYSNCYRNRGKERYITPDDLEVFITIKEKKDLEPLPMSTQSYLAPLADKINSLQITAPQSSRHNLATSQLPLSPHPEKRRNH